MGIVTLGLLRPGCLTGAAERDEYCHPQQRTLTQETSTPGEVTVLERAATSP
jgi:hypothetical protein